MGYSGISNADVLFVCQKASLELASDIPARLLFLCSSVPADGVVFAGLSDIPAALRFLGVAFFFTVLAGFRVAVLALAAFQW